jgi:hypothetical protein
LNFVREFENERPDIEQMLRLAINYEIRGAEPGELTFENEIGVGLIREWEICFLIAAVHILYHIKEIRKRIELVNDITNPMLGLAKIIRNMKTSRQRAVDCTQELYFLMNELKLTANDDIESAIRKLISWTVQRRVKSRKSVSIASDSL